jgi:hypothetical protein
VKRFLSLIFVILGFLLFGLGIKELKNIEHPDQGFFIFKTAEGKIFTHGQVFQNPTDINMYLSYHKVSPSKSEVYIYTRKYNFGEYIEEMFKNPTSLGIALAGLILSAIGIVHMLIPQAQQKSTEVKIVEKTYPPDLERKLKAVRLAIATHRIIPRESIEEAKRILDNIFKEITTLIKMLGELLEKQEAVQEKEEGVEPEEFPQIIKELEMPKLEESPLPMEEFAFEGTKGRTHPNPTNTYRGGYAYGKRFGAENGERLEDVLGSLPLEDIKKVIEEAIKEEIKRGL